MGTTRGRQESWCLLEKTFSCDVVVEKIIEELVNRGLQIVPPDREGFTANIVCPVDIDLEHPSGLLLRGRRLLTLGRDFGRASAATSD